MFGYKTGANQNDINSIRRLAEQGKSAEEISQSLMIVLPCVQSFVNKFKGAAKPKAEPKPEAAPAPQEQAAEGEEDQEGEPQPRKVGRPKKQVF